MQAVQKKIPIAAGGTGKESSFKFLRQEAGTR